MIQKTLSIIKPDAVSRNLIGEIVSKFEASDLRIAAQKKIRLTKEQAEMFYAEHKERPFFASLVEYMTSAPVVVQVLEGEDVIAKNREIMGVTNPKEAEEGTIRRQFALDIERNSVHGSDSQESAEREIRFFFSEIELL